MLAARWGGVMAREAHYLTVACAYVCLALAGGARPSGRGRSSCRAAVRRRACCVVGFICTRAPLCGPLVASRPPGDFKNTTNTHPIPLGHPSRINLSCVGPSFLFGFSRVKLLNKCHSSALVSRTGPSRAESPAICGRRALGTAREREKRVPVMQTLGGKSWVTAATQAHGSGAQVYFGHNR